MAQDQLLELLVDFISDVVGRVFDDLFCLPHSLLRFAFYLLRSAFRLRFLRASNLTNSPFQLANGLVRQPFNLVAFATHDVLRKGHRYSCPGTGP